MSYIDRDSRPSTSSYVPDFKDICKPGYVDCKKCATYSEYVRLATAEKNPQLGVRGNRLVIIKYNADGFFGKISQIIKRVYYTALSCLGIISTDRKAIESGIRRINKHYERQQKSALKNERAVLSNEIASLRSQKAEEIDQLQQQKAKLKADINEMSIYQDLKCLVGLKKKKEAELAIQDRQLTEITEKISSMTRILEEETEKVNKLSRESHALEASVNATKHESERVKTDLQRLDAVKKLEEKLFYELKEHNAYLDKAVDKKILELHQVEDQIRENNIPGPSGQEFSLAEQETMLDVISDELDRLNQVKAFFGAVGEANFQLFPMPHIVRN